MTGEAKQEVLFMLFLAVVILLACIYFLLPERTAFFEFEMQWWSAFMEMFK